jgi:hypothetical protein
VKKGSYEKEGKGMGREGEKGKMCINYNQQPSNYTNSLSLHSRITHTHTKPHTAIATLNLSSVMPVPRRSGVVVFCKRTSDTALSSPWVEGEGRRIRGGGKVEKRRGEVKD